jgi:IclR family pca regulon transcriptional regulator
LERGLLVIQAFSRENPRLTLADVARLTGLTRATARRVLLTLEQLGYARSTGRDFQLTPKVLDLGYAYLSSLNLAEIAQADMEQLMEHTRESCSAAVLDGAEIVYVVRVPTTRIMTVSLGLGSRLPAFCTSMGRVLLADLPEPDARALLAGAGTGAGGTTAGALARGPGNGAGARAGAGAGAGAGGDLPKLTPRTVTDIDALCAELATVRRQGWALVDQELELGVRSIAAPLRDASGRALAAINVSCHPARMDLKTLRGEVLSALLETAGRINQRLSRR